VIRADPYGQFYFPVRGSAGGMPALRDGATVDVEVIAPAREGGIQVRIAGRVLLAAGNGNVSPGATLAMRVSVVDGTVFLRPLSRPSQTAASMLAELGLPESPVSSFIVSFLGASGVRFDPGKMRLYLKLAARFPGREEAAAEAAVLLDRSGIGPTETAIARLLLLFDGESGFSASDGRRSGENADDGNDRDLLRAINRKREDGRQWIVIPFVKDIEYRRFIGSVRFLVDLDTRATVETRVTVKDGDRRWAFILADGTCRFTANPPFGSVVLEKFVVYLKSILMPSGVTSVAWDTSGGAAVPGFPRVDLEI
jgi:hypothetical protein